MTKCERCGKEKRNFEMWVGRGVVDGYESLCTPCAEVLEGLRDATVEELREALKKKEKAA